MAASRVSCTVKKRVPYETCTLFFRVWESFVHKFLENPGEARKTDENPGIVKKFGKIWEHGTGSRLLKFRNRPFAP